MRVGNALFRRTSGKLHALLPLIFSLSVTLPAVCARAQAAHPDPNPGGTVDFLSYLPSGSSSMGIRETDPDARPTPPPCPGCASGTTPVYQPCQPDILMFHVAKGDGVPWGKETYFVWNGWIYLIEEIGCCLPGTTVDSAYRAFRECQTWKKGFRFAPSSFPTGGFLWTQETYKQEIWEPNCGNPPIHHVDLDSECGTGGSGHPASVQFEGVWPGFLSERRSGRQGSGPYDVAVISKAGSWGPATDRHYYGKYWDPVQQEWIGVGQLAFSDQSPPTLPSATYLVDFNPSISCTSCPDPM